MISVAAELAGMHPQTLRIYEARGLITPSRSPRNTRLYSAAGRRASAPHPGAHHRARHEPRGGREGLRARGRAGPPRGRLEQEVERMRRRIAALEAEAERAREELVTQIERVHRSYNAELVPTSRRAWRLCRCGAARSSLAVAARGRYSRPHPGLVAVDPVVPALGHDVRDPTCAGPVPPSARAPCRPPPPCRPVRRCTARRGRRVVRVRSPDSIAMSTLPRWPCEPDCPPGRRPPSAWSGRCRRGSAAARRRTGATQASASAARSSAYRDARRRVASTVPAARRRPAGGRRRGSA